MDPNTTDPEKYPFGTCWKVTQIVTYNPPTLTGAGPPTNGEYQQGLQLVALTG